MHTLALMGSLEGWGAEREGWQQGTVGRGTRAGVFVLHLFRRALRRTSQRSRISSRRRLSSRTLRRTSQRSRTSFRASPARTSRRTTRRTSTPTRRRTQCPRPHFRRLRALLHAELHVRHETQCQNVPAAEFLVPCARRSNRHRPSLIFYLHSPTSPTSKHNVLDQLRDQHG